MDEAIDVLVGLAALVVGGGVGFAAGRGWVPVSKRRGEKSPRVAAGVEQDWARAEQGRPWESPPDGDGQPLQERDRLVGSCVDLADRLRDRQPALYKALTRDLEAIGVTVRIADSEPFDATRHNAVGTEPASDPGQHLLVAETTRLGYLDHGVQVRVPDVIVYRWEER
jgi:hypothetical protein